MHTYIHTYIESPPSRTMIHLLLHTKQGGGWGTGGTFQAFLCWWICHMQLLQLSLGIHQSVLFVWNFGCTVICHYSCFWIICSNNLKSRRIIAFYLFSVWKWVHKIFLGGFTLEHSILIRISWMFLFCFAHFLFILGYCSTGCFKGNTERFSTPMIKIKSCSHTLVICK